MFTRDQTIVLYRVLKKHITRRNKTQTRYMQLKSFVYLSAVISTGISHSVYGWFPSKN